MNCLRSYHIPPIELERRIDLWLYRSSYYTPTCLVERLLLAQVVQVTKPLYSRDCQTVSILQAAIVLGILLTFELGGSSLAHWLYRVYLSDA